MRKSENGIKKIDEVFVSNISKVCATDEKLSFHSSSTLISINGIFWKVNRFYPFFRTLAVITVVKGRKHGKSTEMKNIKLYKHPNPKCKKEVYVIPKIYTE